MGLIFRIIVMILAMGSVVFVMYKLNTTGIDPAIFYLDPAETASFNPDHVTKFEWRTANKIFSYDRDNTGRWLPAKNEPKLNALLKFLSYIQLNEVEQKGASSLNVALDIENTRWEGSWDGLSFVWKTGPHAGKGEILSDKKNIAFFKGALIFEDFEMNLCPNRITKVVLRAHGKDYQIEQIERGWQITKPISQALDPVFFEKWLAGLCKVKVKSLLDLSYAPSSSKQGFIEFYYANGEKISLPQVEKDFFLVNLQGREAGAILEGLSGLQEELKKQLQPSTNP